MYLSVSLAMSRYRRDVWYKKARMILEHNEMADKGQRSFWVEMNEFGDMVNTCINVFFRYAQLVWELCSSGIRSDIVTIHVYFRYAELVWFFCVGLLNLSRQCRYLYCGTR